MDLDADAPGQPPSDEELAARLRSASFEVVGRFADASNATLLVRLTDRDPRTLAELGREHGRDPELDDLDPTDLAVHKPRRGESPLWDFPDGTLHHREVAAYEVSAALGWDLVPVTVMVEGGPFGPGSLQRYVPHDPATTTSTCSSTGTRRCSTSSVPWSSSTRSSTTRTARVVTCCSNGSTERAGRIGGQVRLVDHGVSFNEDHKLRTVGWHFAGEPVPQRLRSDVARLADQLAGGASSGRLERLLSARELEVLVQRAAVVAATEVFAEPSGRRPFPWPLI